MHIISDLEREKWRILLLSAHLHILTLWIKPFQMMPISQMVTRNHSYCP